MKLLTGVCRCNEGYEGSTCASRISLPTEGEGGSSMEGRFLAQLYIYGIV
jgi:hypothetical protein